MASKHPSVEALLKHIARDDIPEGDPRYLVVRSVSYTAQEVASQGYALEGPELTTALRKLLEAEDCLIRAVGEREEARALMLARDADHG